VYTSNPTFTIASLPLIVGMVRDSLATSKNGLVAFPAEETLSRS
jgi:hypothetical protein